MDKPRQDLIARLSNCLANEIDQFVPAATQPEILTAIALLAVTACVEFKLTTDQFLIAMKQLENKAIGEGLIPGSN